MKGIVKGIDLDGFLLVENAENGEGTGDDFLSKSIFSTIFSIIFLIELTPAGKMANKLSS